MKNYKNQYISFKDKLHFKVKKACHIVIQNDDFLNLNIFNYNIAEIICWTHIAQQLMCTGLTEFWVLSVILITGHTPKYLCIFLCTVFIKQFSFQFVHA